MATQVVSTFTANPGLVGTIGAAVFNPLTGATVQARSTSGIAEDAPGSYAYAATLSPDLGYYLIAWDMGAGLRTFADLYVVPAAGGGGGTGTVGVPTIINNPDTTLDALDFIIKRNDTVPNMRRQLRYSDSTLPNLTVSGTLVYFTMRLATGAATAFVGAPFLHMPCTIPDPTNAIVNCDWSGLAVGGGKATSLEGVFAGEFEVTYPAGGIETFPNTTYMNITVYADLDPGINP